MCTEGDEEWRGVEEDDTASRSRVFEADVEQQGFDCKQNASCNECPSLTPAYYPNGCACRSQTGIQEWRAAGYFDRDLTETPQCTQAHQPDAAVALMFVRCGNHYVRVTAL